MDAITSVVSMSAFAGTPYKDEIHAEYGGAEERKKPGFLIQIFELLNKTYLGFSLPVYFVRF